MLDLQFGKWLVAEVSDKDAEAGRRLLERLAPHAASLVPGTTVDVELEWACIRLRADEDRVYAEEPNYALDAHDFRASLAITALIEATQHRLMRRLNINPQRILARQYVHVSSEAMDAPWVSARRRGRPLHRLGNRACI
jgi:hypothetical protein